MKNRVMSGCVMVSGSLFSSCSWKIGTTLPVDPRTFPNRTATYGRPGPTRRIGHEHLGDPLAGAHDARRPDGLVGRDEHEPLHIGGDARLEQGEGPAHVDVDRVRRVVLHHRDVLVGRGVEDDVRSLEGDEAVDRRPAGHVDQVRAHVTATQTVLVPRLERPLDHVERAFGTIHQHQPARAEGVDLPCELGSDRSARARDEDRATFDDLPDGRGMVCGRWPAEEVIDLDRPDPVRVERPVEQVVDGRHRAHGQTEGHGRIHDATDRLPAGSRHRDQQRFCARGLDGTLHRLDAPEHPEVAHVLAFELRVVIEIADREDAGVRVAQGRPGDDVAGLARAIEQRPTDVRKRGARLILALGRGADGEADTAKDSQADEQLGDPERSREAIHDGRTVEVCRLRPAEGVHDSCRHERPGDDTDEDPLELGDAGHPPAAVVQPALDAGGDAGEHQDRDDRRVPDEALGRDLAVEPERQGEEGREREADDVDDHEMPGPQPIGDGCS